MSVQSTPEFGIRLRAHLAGRRRGFTAIEMMAVATIMVILSLILVMNVRKRVDESKVAAAKEEMNELGAKVESLVYAETGHFFILQDLDNNDNYPAAGGTDMPMSYYVGTTVTLFASPMDPRRIALRKTPNQWNTNSVWDGPYTQFKRYMTVGDIKDGAGNLLSSGLATMRPELFWDGTVNHQGPIYPYITNDDKYPLDPWGNPYIFEVRVDNAGKTIGGRIYSLGPDGMPGPITAAQVGDINYQNGLYFHTFVPGKTPPDLGKLGIPGQTGDDLVLEF